MPWPGTARGLALVCLIVLAPLGFVACGGAGADPGDAVEAASQHRDDVYGEYLLAEVEVDRARFKAAEAESAGPPQSKDGEQRELRQARHFRHLCWEGNAFEYCPQLEQIDAIIGELEEATR